MGFFGEDMTLLNSKSKNISILHENEPDHSIENTRDTNILATLFNYEISSNEMSNTLNKVSKHCIIKENPFVKNDHFYSQKYYYHLNRYFIVITFDKGIIRP